MIRRKVGFYFLTLSLTASLVSAGAFAGGRGRAKSPQISPLSAAEEELYKTNSETCKSDRSFQDIETECEETKACSALLKDFPEDCQTQCVNNKIEEGFKAAGVNSEFLAEYRTLRLVNKNDMRVTQKDGLHRPWELYSPSPKTWVKWERGNFYRAQLNKKLMASRSEKDGNEWTLEMKDLQELHQKYMEKDLVLPSYLTFLYRFEAFRKWYPLPGDLRKSGSTKSGFTHEVTPEVKRALQEEMLEKRKDGEHTIHASFDEKKNGNYVAKIRYVHPDSVEEALETYVATLNEAMNGYLNGTKKDESPIAFAARMQRDYVKIHPMNEGQGRMSRFVQDMILGALNLPFIPGGGLQDDVIANPKKYEFNTRAVLKSMLGSKVQCLKEYELNQCLQSKRDPRIMGDIHFGVSPGCRPVYGEGNNAPVQKTIVDGLVQDAMERQCVAEKANVKHHEKVEALKDDLLAIHEHTQVLHSGDDSPGLKVACGAQLMSDQTKKEFIESLAEPLKAKLKAYSWVTGKGPGIARRMIYTNPALFKKFVLNNHEDADDSSKIFAGNGLYASTNPFDSAEFSVDPSIRKGDTDAFEQEYKEKTPDQYSAEMKDFMQKIGKGELLAIEVKKGQRFLDLSSPAIEAALDAAHLTEQDIYTLNPNVVVARYSNSKLVKNTWMNIKLTDPHAFTVKKADVTDFNLNEAVRLYYGRRSESYKGPYGHHALEPIVQHHMEKLEAKKAQWIRENDEGRKFYNPFEDKCYYLKGGKAFEARRPNQCSLRSSYEKSLKDYGLALPWSFWNLF